MSLNWTAGQISSKNTSNYSWNNSCNWMNIAEITHVTPLKILFSHRFATSQGLFVISQLLQECKVQITKVVTKLCTKK